MNGLGINKKLYYMDKLIGFIGQGWVGKNYADDFEKRGFKVVRYSLEPAHIKNREEIKECDIVFIAVPTPTIPEKGFIDNIVREAVKLVGEKKVAVVKSTLLPGSTESIQADNPGIYVFHSPEFLTRHTAAYDAANPARNIIGIPVDSDEHRQKAEEVMAVLPPAPFKIICHSKDAELAKYGGNCFFYFKNIFMNLFHDLARGTGRDWDAIRKIVIADPRIGEVHTEPVNKGGRGAGGDCLIKDFEVFLQLYKEAVGNEFGIKALESVRNKNIYLLAKSNKDVELLKGVYGEEIINEFLKGMEEKVEELEKGAQALKEETIAEIKALNEVEKKLESQSLIQ